MMLRDSKVPLIRLALSNQHAIRLYIGHCIFERFSSISILQIHAKASFFRQGHSYISSIPQGPTIPLPQYQTIPGQAPSLAMVLGYIRAIVGGCIDVVDFGHEGVAFSCFCGHLLRIPPPGIHIRPSTALQA